MPVTDVDAKHRKLYWTSEGQSLRWNIQKGMTKQVSEKSNIFRPIWAQMLKFQREASIIFTISIH